MARKKGKGRKAKMSANKQPVEETAKDQNSAQKPDPKSDRKPLQDIPNHNKQPGKKVRGAARKARAHELDPEMPRMSRFRHGESQAYGSALTPYGPVESKARLEKEGFHPQVTNLKVREVTVNWLLFAKKMLEKPSREQYLAGRTDHNGETRSVSRQLTRGPLIFRPEFIREDFDSTSVRDGKSANILADMLESPFVGGQIIELIFADGIDTVQSVALTCTRVWHALAASSHIWDFQANQFRTNGYNGVYMVTAPEYTIGEFLKARQDDPFGEDSVNFVSGWSSQAILHEAVVNEMAILCAMRNETESKPEQPTESLPGSSEESEGSAPITTSTLLEPRVLEAIKKIKSIKDIYDSSQFVIKSELQLFEAQPGLALGSFQQMVTQLNTSRAAIRVLYFHKTPFLDRRVLAIILRSCPRVTTLGVYDCPLIHFGDVVCILDLIWEINKERRAASVPPIRSFDFFPRYHNGMPYKFNSAGGFGVTWGPQKLEVVQRGFFLTVLKAFMKSKVMKLDLFSKDKAFVRYLHCAPNHPLAVPCFLDGLYRFMDLNPQKSTDYANEYQRIVYDMLKQVRLGLERIDKDSPRYYNEIMGSHMYFCSSCGYEMFEEFFTAEARSTRPHRRLCSGCTLNRYLDHEQDHLKDEIKDIITCLLPNWNEDEHNLDAPIPTKGVKLINLFSTVSIRPDRPGLVINEDGFPSEPDYAEPFVRDNKIHSDSLQNLPSLAELASKEYTAYWQAANRKCSSLELYRKYLYLLHQQQDNEKTEPLYVANDIDEKLSKNPFRGSVQSNDFGAAIRFYAGLQTKGW